MFQSKLKCLMLAVCVLAGLDLAFARPAQADAQFCNHKGFPIQISYRTQFGTPADNYFVSQGWLYVDAYSCIRLMGGDASLFYHYISMYTVSSPPVPVPITDDVPRYYCVRWKGFRYTGSPSACPNEYFAAPFYRYSASTWDATFSLD